MKKNIYFFLLFSIGLLRAQQVSIIHSIQYSDYNFARALTCDKDGNIFIAGRFGSSQNEDQKGVYIHKYSPSQGIIWKDTAHVGSLSSAVIGLAVDVGGNCYFSRAGQVHFQDKIFEGDHLVKYDPSGQIVWLANSSACFNLDFDKAGSVFVASNKIYKYSVSGSPAGIISPPGPGNIFIDSKNNFYIVTLSSIDKLDPSGNLLWSHPAQIDSRIVLDHSGNCYLSETGFEFNSPFTKLDPNGNVLWSMSLPFFGAYALHCDASDNIYIVGVRGVGQAIEGVEIRKISGQGVTLQLYQLPGSASFRPNGILEMNGSLYMSTDRAFYYDALLLKIEMPDETQTLLTETSVTGDDFFVYPNPSNSVFEVKYKNTEDCGSLSINVFDLLGECIYSRDLKRNPGEQKEVIELGEFPKGIYSLQISDEKNKRVKTIIIN